MKKYIFLVFIFLGFYCAPQTPIDIQAYKEECAHCKMKIVDLKFNTQLQTEKGKIFHFDSIECLVEWIHQNPDVKIRDAWVKDYLTGEWINYKKAVYFNSKEIPSPMGAYLSAFKDKKTHEGLKKNGKILEYSELWNYLQSIKNFKENEKDLHH